MYENGQGVEQSYAAALKYYQQAARLGNSSAEYNLGTMYYYGEGVPRSLTLAEMYFQLAVYHGNEDAESALEIVRQEKGK